MAAENDNVVKIVYDGFLEHITYSGTPNYQEIMQIACERFSIPQQFMNSIQLTNDTTYSFAEDTFEYFLELFPSPMSYFFINVDHDALNKTVLKPKKDASDKRRRNYDEYGFRTVTRQNCFIGEYPEAEIWEEPKPKKQKRTGKGLDRAMSMILKNAGSLHI